MISIENDPLLNTTFGVKYLGSKKQLLPHILRKIREIGAQTAIDVFSGTTRVAQYLRLHDIKTTTSDMSWATSCYALTYVHNADNAHLREFVDRMNEVAPVRGWLTENYTGSDPALDREDGRCFQPKNAMKADAARDLIETLSLDPWEKATLVTSIIRGLDAVDNTVGVQQAYLKEWCKRSYKDIVFELPTCLQGPRSLHHEGDCLNIDYEPHDLAYLDPPYSPHSYATYYHIWDSIARWDKPQTALKARRRIDRVAKSEHYDPGMESPWNRPDRALGAFGALIERLPVRWVLVSYSDESIVAKADLLAMAESYGKVTVSEIDYGRNIMSQIGNSARNETPEKGQRNKELLIMIEKNTF